jgi:hypothetical protein
MFQSPETWSLHVSITQTRLLHVSIAQKMAATLGSVKSKLKAET